jgi:hypothetical protein
LNKRRKRGQDPDEKANSLILQEALSISVQLDKFPKNVIEIYVTVLESFSSSITNTSVNSSYTSTSCSELAFAITCSSLALADSGIELMDLVAASSSCFIDTYLDGRCLLAPSKEEEAFLRYARNQNGANAKALSHNQRQLKTESGSESEKSTSKQTNESKEVQKSVQFGTTIISLLPSLQQISYIQQICYGHDESANQHVNSMMELCLQGCSQVDNIMRETLAKAALKKSKTTSMPVV